ncbi:MAG: glutathione S-transferase family protein [Gammaproteobacteria bacterium]|nr:glutathione S-transferase family protein [Gammaproteobacteria bacterium]
MTTEKPLLVSFTICPFAHRTAIVLRLKNRPYFYESIDLQNKPQWFLNEVPTGKVPALFVATDSGQDVIFESAIINEFLDESFPQPLAAATPLARAKERSWIAYSEQLILQQFNLMCAQDKQTFDELLVALVENLSKLKPAVGEPYFDGVRFGLVDAALAPLFYRLKWLPRVKLAIRDQARHSDGAQRLFTWMETLADSPVVREALPQGHDQAFVDFFMAKDSYALV